MKPQPEKPSVSRWFPHTDWEAVTALKDGGGDNHLHLLNRLAASYWAPMHQFLLMQGVRDEDARDLVQDFFAYAFESRLFQKADRKKGRFRSFLLAALTNFVANFRRRDRAQKRRPAEGIASLDELTADYVQPNALVEQRNPAVAFHEAWIRTVVQNVLRTMETECTATGKRTHYLIFHARVVAPELDGDASPSLEELAAVHGLGSKEAANQIVTAKRIFRRLLAREVRAYANSDDDASDEQQDIFGYLRFGTDS